MLRSRFLCCALYHRKSRTPHNCCSGEKQTFDWLDGDLEPAASFCNWSQLDLDIRGLRSGRSTNSKALWCKNFRGTKQTSTSEMSSQSGVVSKRVNE
jgi:hypothetical protein